MNSHVCGKSLQLFYIINKTESHSLSQKGVSVYTVGVQTLSAVTSSKHGFMDFKSDLI